MNGTLPNTTQTNYATDYVILEKMFSVFSGVWQEFGYDWEDFLFWSERAHIPAMQVATLHLHIAPLDNVLNKDYF